MRGPRLLRARASAPQIGARRNAMLKLAFAAIFAASVAGAGAIAACIDPSGESARSASRFTQYETPNHRHLLRHREAQRGD
jgi:hypothetical protein